MQRRSIIRGAVATGAAATMAFGLAACSVESEDGGDENTENVDLIPEGEGEITIGYINWDEAVVATGLWDRILSDAGYTVTTQEFADAGPLFEGIAAGDIDFFLDGWLPVTHQNYLDEYGDDLEDLGIWLDDADLTIAVPTYVEGVDSLADLNDNAELFGGQIIGIEAGAGLTQVTENEVIPTYGITDLDLVTSSTATMLTELDAAYSAEEPIVVTLWMPHRAYGQYDLKNLEDPEGALGAGESIHTLTRTGFADDFPEIAEALGGFTMTVEQVHELEGAVFLDHDGDVDAGVEAWIAENDLSTLIS